MSGRNNRNFVTMNVDSPAPEAYHVEQEVLVMAERFKSVDALPVIEELPDVLGGADTPEKWAARRLEIKEMLAHYMLGTRPKNDVPARGEVLSSAPVYGGAGIREEVRLHIGGGEHFDIQITRPNRDGRFPAIVWSYFPHAKECPIGAELLEQGYILAAFDYNAVLKDDAADPASPARRAYPEADWAAVAVWGWGFSKAADYLLTLDCVDPAKLICTGHSRNGKAALAAGAYDERFSVVAPINSGCGGAGCFRFLGDEKKIVQDPVKVESLGRIVHTFPHWFSTNLTPFGTPEPPHPIARENQLPFDLHFLKALVAPRALITIEGTADLWANAYGTYLTRIAAQPAFELLGVPGHNFQIIRDGKHEYAARDWRWVLTFAQAAFEGRT